MHGREAECLELQNLEVKFRPARAPARTGGSTGDCAGYCLSFACRACEADCVELYERMIGLDRVGKAVGGCPDRGSGVGGAKEIDPQPLAEECERHKRDGNQAEPDKRLHRLYLLSLTNMLSGRFFPNLSLRTSSPDSGTVSGASPKA